MQSLLKFCLKAPLGVVGSAALLPLLPSFFSPSLAQDTLCPLFGCFWFAIRPYLTLRPALSDGLRYSSDLPTDGDVLTAGLEDTAEDSVLENPGEFKELDMQKRFDMETVEGLNAMVTTVLQGDSSSSFLVQHNMSVCSGPTNAYHMTVSSDSSHEALNGVLQNTPDGLIMQAIMRKPVSDWFSMQAHGLFQNYAASAGRVEGRVTGPDYTAVAFASLGQRLGGNGVGVNYFQSVTKHLALGADTFFTSSNMEYLTTVAYSVYGAYNTGPTCVLAKYDRARNDLCVRYWRQLESRLKVGTSINVDLERLESKLEFAYEMPIRVEDGGFPYTVLKGKLFSDLRFLTQVDHTLLNGQGMASLHASMDHFKQDYKFGVSLRLQA